VRDNEVLLIPSGVPHEAEAIEETLTVDVFSPIRQDWLDRTDVPLVVVRSAGDPPTCDTCPIDETCGGFHGREPVRSAP
jgi:hypothetical protein